VSFRFKTPGAFSALMDQRTSHRGDTSGHHAVHRRRARYGARGPARPGQEHPLALGRRKRLEPGRPDRLRAEARDYWAGEYDWRAQERELNAFPQFKTTIDGQPIHFVHVRSANPDATPLLLLHGYPSSFVETTRLIGPLVDPVAHGGRPEDAFHVSCRPCPGSGSRRR
jgi:hypothetical protein